MGIYRGAGGTGDAIADSSSEALLVRNLAIEVQADADAAAASAAAALVSENNAETAATNAQTAETNAETAEANAETAQAAAESARNAAQTAQTAAETAQTAAATSATNAASSATAAANSATSAASSASTATTQATNASNSASAAATSATNASNSASAAATSATNAASSATSASGSATSASNSASSASTSASSAATSETNAATSASTATTQAGIATTKAGEAATSASNAASSASSASTSASNAATSETNAASSASTASSAASAALASLDSFDDRYLGAKSSEPTLDNDGNALASGALYFNTVSNTMKVYTGSIWVDAYADGATFLAKENNLSDLPSVSTARTNLGLGTAALVADSTLVHTSGNETIGGTKTFSVDASISGLTVGKGGGAVVGNASLGASALQANTSGALNTAVGSYTNSFAPAALYSNTTGNYNSAFGAASLAANTTGSNNTSVGSQALQANTTASNNTAVGYQAGYSNQTGQFNSYFGRAAGYLATGGQNTFIGDSSGYNSTGTLNSYLGSGAGVLMTSGSKNTIVGAYNGNQGGLDIRASGNNIVISDGDGTPGFYYTSSASAWYLPATYNVATASAANMVIFSGGLMARSTSALKYKTDIRDLPSIDVNKFRPVIYKSKGELDDKTKDHFGVIADEVDEAGIKELVTYGIDGEVEGFQYERLTVVLLKAIQELKAELDATKAEVAAMKAGA